MEKYYQGLKHFYPKTFDPNFEGFAHPIKAFKYNGQTITRSQFIEEIIEFTGAGDDLAFAVNKIIELHQLSDQELTQTVPGLGNLETFGAEAEKTSAEVKRTQVESKQAVETAIKKQQQIYEEEITKTRALEETLKKQKIYYEIEEKVVEETQEVKNLRQQAEADPKKFIKDAATQFKTNPNVKDLPATEAAVATQQAAVTTYDTLTENPNSVSFQSTVVKNIVSSPELLKKIAPGAEEQNVLKDIGDYLSDSKTAQFELVNQFADLSKTKGASFNIKLFDSAGPGRKVFDLSQIASQHIESLNQQNLLLGNLRDFGGSEIRSQLLLRMGGRLESYIAKLPANSLLAKTYNSDFVQTGLSSLGIVKTAPWAAVEGSWLGKIIVGSGFGPVAGFIQAKTGINLGVKLAAKTGATMAVKTGTKALITKATTALSTAIPLPVANWIIGYIGGEIIGKIVEKIPWGKIKKYGLAIASIPLIGGGLLFGVPLLTIGGAGLGAVGLGIGRGITAREIGGGVSSFFGAVAGATLTSVGIPILTTLLVFPVIVALILFIINSGAYIAPPAPRGELSGAVITSPYIDVIKTASPAGPFENSNLPLTVEYTIQVKAKKGSLTNVVIDYSCRVVKKSSSTVCPETEPEVPTAVEGGISPALAFTFKYKQTYNALNYQDSFITDTLTVKADAAESKGEEAAGSATIKIGNPPEECPSIWPTGSGYITQGAYTGSGMSHSAMEAIDVGVSHTSVLAGHSGTVVTAQKDSCLGNYIQIKSSCNGKDFTSQYAHLEGVKVKAGQAVAMGQTIGLSGNTGSCTSGPHLHYRFKYYPDGNPSWPKNPPFMMNPYIPKDVPRGCKTVVSCGVSY